MVPKLILTSQQKSSLRKKRLFSPRQLQRAYKQSIKSLTQVKKEAKKIRKIKSAGSS